MAAFEMGMRHDISQLVGCCLSILVLNAASLAAGTTAPAPVTEPLRLPRSVGFQLAAEEPTAAHAYVTVWYARRAVDETSLDDQRRQAAGRFLEQAEMKLREMRIKAQKESAPARQLDAQAAAVRDELDQDLSTAIDDSEMRDLIERISILFFQELLLFNGPSSFLSETAPGIGLNLTAEQQAKLRPLLAAADEAFQAHTDRIAQGEVPDPIALEESAADQVSTLRSHIRIALTPEQRQRWDQWVLEELAQMGRD